MGLWIGLKPLLDEIGISNRFTLTYYENMCRFTLNLNYTKQW